MHVLVVCLSGYACGVIAVIFLAQPSHIVARACLRIGWFSIPRGGHPVCRPCTEDIASPWMCYIRIFLFRCIGPTNMQKRAGDAALCGHVLFVGPSQSQCWYNKCIYVFCACTHRSFHMPFPLGFVYDAQSSSEPSCPPSQ